MLGFNVSSDNNALNDLLGRFRAMMSEADQNLQEALLESVKSNIVVVAKSLAPVKTGALRESIDAEPGDDPFTVIIYASALYAPFLEFGTKYIAEGKYSFLRPAIAMQINKVIEDVTNALIQQLNEI
ncbi:MAG: HK97-gp10 family putative phage morphogenesis protein [Nitrosotalea sp.]